MYGKHNSSEFFCEKEVFGKKHPKRVLKLSTPCITFILAIFFNLHFNAQFYMLSYTYLLATPMRFNARGIILGESTIQLFDLLARQTDINTVQSHRENAALQR
jgi:hypothetical protein